MTPPVFDSTIVIDYLRGVSQAHAVVEHYADKSISIITWMEVMVGALTEQEKSRVTMFLKQFRIIGVDKNIATEAVRLRQVYRLKVPDALIMATAKTHSTLLITRDKKDMGGSEPYVRIPYAL